MSSKRGVWAEGFTRTNAEDSVGTELDEQNIIQMGSCRFPLRLMGDLNGLLYVNGLEALELVGSGRDAIVDLRPLLQLHKLRQLRLKHLGVSFGTTAVLAHGVMLDGFPILEDCTLLNCGLAISVVEHFQGGLGGSGPVSSWGENQSPTGICSFLANADVGRFVGPQLRRLRLEGCRLRGLDLSGRSWLRSFDWLQICGDDSGTLQFLDVAGTRICSVGDFLVYAAGPGPLFIDCSGAPITDVNALLLRDFHNIQNKTQMAGKSFSSSVVVGREVDESQNAAIAERDILQVTARINTLLLRGTELQSLAGLAHICPALEVLDCSHCPRLRAFDVGAPLLGPALPRMRLFLAERTQFPAILPAGAMPGLQAVDLTDAAMEASEEFFTRAALFCVISGKTRAQLPQEDLVGRRNRGAQNFCDHLGLILSQTGPTWGLPAAFDGAGARNDPAVFFELRQRWKTSRMLFLLWAQARGARLRDIALCDAIESLEDQTRAHQYAVAKIDAQGVFLERATQEITTPRDSFQ